MNSAIGLVLPDFLPSAFRFQDIRGVVPDVIDSRFAHALGMAIGVETMGAVVVGRDGRASSVELGAALQAGIRSAGADVIDVGRVTAPMVHFSCRLTDATSAVIVTGGHQPAAYNGFRIMLDGVLPDAQIIQRLRRRMHEPALPADAAGRRSHLPSEQCYLARIQSDIRLNRPMKIAVDCGNGVTGASAPRLLRDLGCDVTELFSDIDGTFPNHAPNPSDPANLQELIYCLRYTDCEIGLAFDGDGSRLGVVTKSGQVIWPDRQLILFARDLLARRPGAVVLYDNKCSRDVALEIAAAGGTPVMCKSGEADFRARMRETGASLAGDMDGRFTFKERWYGINDALYAAGRLLEIVSRHADASAVLEELPQSCATPKIKVDTLESEHVSLIDGLRSKGRFEGALDVNLADGVRVEYSDGLGVARPSHSSSAVIVRFEADTPLALQRIQGQFRHQLLRVAPHLQLPF